MQKITGLVIVFSFLSFYTPVTAVHAQNLCPPGGNFSNLCKIQPGKIGGVVGSLAEFIIVLAILLCVFFLLYGGFRYVTSGGDKGKVDQARATLVAAIIGLVIALLAFFIVNIILVVLTGKGLSSLSLPTLLQ